MLAADARLGLSVQSSVIGFAVYSPSAGLLDWGTICCRYHRGDQALSKIAVLIEKYGPIELKIEDHRSNTFRRGEVACLRIKQALMLARKQGLSAKQLSPHEMKQNLNLDPSSNRHDISLLIAKLFPVLADRLPKPRKIWQSESRGMSMFMAVALAIAE